MVAIKDAVSAVNTYLRSFPGLLDPKSPRLEETEFDQASGQWVITVSYETEPSSGLGMIGDSRQRLYRVFRVGESGEVLSMKERTLSPASRKVRRRRSHSEDKERRIDVYRLVGSISLFALGAFLLIVRWHGTRTGELPERGAVLSRDKNPRIFQYAQVSDDSLSRAEKELLRRRGDPEGGFSRVISSSPRSGHIRPPWPRSVDVRDRQGGGAEGDERGLAELKVHSQRALNVGRKRAEIFAECARG